MGSYCIEHGKNYQLTRQKYGVSYYLSFVGVACAGDLRLSAVVDGGGGL